MHNNCLLILLRRLSIALFYVGLAWIQCNKFVFERPADEPWILYAQDTVSHDIPVQMWMWQQVADSGGRMPLWMPPLHGGLPSLGAWLWTPFSPTLWLHAAMPVPDAHRWQFVLAFAWASLGAYWLARVLGLRVAVAVFVGAAAGLSGHLVTLIHAGHLQKILALAWLPWFAAGACKALAAGSSPAGVARGASIAAVALGMAFLCGHPQIAYSMIMLLGLRAAWMLATREWRGGVWKSRIPVAAGILALGLCAGGAQLVPGLEMGSLSNRAQGVKFEEAVETSYPPFETLEFLLPRFLGDSSAITGGKYFGQWGERLVSDYAGAFVVLLAAFALTARSRARESWFWALVAIVSLVVGYGKYTPVYELLYNFWPGMKGFRSPGTFFCGVALAIPALAGIALDTWMSRLEDEKSRDRWRLLTMLGTIMIAAALVFALALFYGQTAQGRTVDFTSGERILRDALLANSIMRSGIMVAGTLFGFILMVALFRGERGSVVAPITVALFVAVDLMDANSMFLRAEPWKRYEAYLAPNDIDVAVADDIEPRRVYEPGLELSLAPILRGRDSMLGYHPISYALFEEHLSRTGVGTPEWRAQWGIRDVAMAGKPENAPATLQTRAAWKGSGDSPDRYLLRDTTTPAPVRFVSTAETTTSATLEWIERTPDAATLRVSAPTAGTVIVAETMAPGWRWRLDGGEWRRAAEVALDRRVDVESGDHEIAWEYRPQSYRAGMFLTSMGLVVAMALMLARDRRCAA